MTPFAGYVWRIICGAVICAIIDVFTENKSGLRRISRILSGIYMAIIILSPITDISTEGIFERWNGIHYEGQQAAATGEAQALSAKREIIKTNIEAYILKKAAESGLQLQVAVTVSDDLIPVRVTISGNASPVERRRLQSIIETDLGISKENQAWN